MTEKSDLFNDQLPADETLTDKIEANENGFTRLLRKVPGLGSYIDKNNRRGADQLLRDTIAKRLAESRLQLSNVHVALSKDIVKAMDYAEPLGRADTRLAGLIGKIEAAPSGYAGWLDAIKIAEPELDQIYAFDAQFLEHADDVAIGVAALEKAVSLDGDIATAIGDLDGTIQRVQTAFNDRNELLSGFSAE